MTDTIDVQTILRQCGLRVDLTAGDIETIYEMFDDGCRVDEVTEEVFLSEYQLNKLIKHLGIKLPYGPRPDPDKRANVLECIRQFGPQSCREIARKLRKNPRGIQRYVNEPRGNEDGVRDTF